MTPVREKKNYEDFRKILLIFSQIKKRKDKCVTAEIADILWFKKKKKKCICIGLHT